MIPHVEPGGLITATRQNDLIDKVNEHGEDILALQAASGDPDAVQGMIDASLEEHINSETPHPVYDTAHSFELRFLNRLV